MDLRSELRAEQGFKQLLEATPGITHAWPWPMVKRKVPLSLQHLSLPMLVLFKNQASLGNCYTLLRFQILSHITPLSK